MLRIQGGNVFTGQMTRAGATGALFAFALAGAGCSTDFRRLENPGLSQGERPALPTAGLNARRNAGAPVPTNEPWTESGPRGALPPVTGNIPPAFNNGPTAAPAQPSTAGLSKPFDRPKAATPAAVPAGAKAPIAAGEQIEVQQGDSLYSISKRHKVSIAALMDLNQLKNPNLKPGQKLVLPAGPGIRRPIEKTGTQVASAGTAVPPSAVTTPAAAPAPAPAAPSAVASGDWNGSYTVKPGDSLYAVARQHKVQLADLQRQNNITDPTKVRPGTVIKVPGTSEAVAAAVQAPATAAPRPTQIAAAPSAPAAAVGGVVAPKIINVQPAAPTGGAPVAPAFDLPASAPTPTPAIAPVTAEKPANAKAAGASSAATAGSGKFQWPVKGQLVGSFGKRADGSPSDGVGIAVPAGTAVHAAQDGTVAYAGSELKGYGNLILVRHEGGWVTAYAHASEILVKRGDAVKRGQTIAKSGQTGGADKPMVHFELRKDSQPVDPAPHMDRM